MSGLKTTAEATERKTRDAIDAVQGTLEAVVKRMAFLERDAAPAEDRRPAEQPSAPLRKPAEPNHLGARTGAADAGAEATETSDQPPPGLLSRLPRASFSGLPPAGGRNRSRRAGRERRSK